MTLRISVEEVEWSSVAQSARSYFWGQQKQISSINWVLISWNGGEQKDLYILASNTVSMSFQSYAAP